MKLTSLERRLAITISGIYGLRMFGLFLVMPVLVVYAEDFPDFTPALAGLAIGIYGLGQAFLQMPVHLPPREEIWDRTQSLRFLLVHRQCGPLLSLQKDVLRHPKSGK